MKNGKITKTNKNGNTLEYGIDHIEGLFYRVVSPEGNDLESDSQEHNPRLNIEVIAEFVKKWGFNIDYELPEKVIDYEA